MRGNKAFDKKHLEQLVVKYGGDFCQKRTDDNDAMIISSVDTSKSLKDREAVIRRLMGFFIVPIVKGQIRKGLTIVKPEWIVESIQRKRMLPLISE